MTVYLVVSALAYGLVLITLLLKDPLKDECPWMSKIQIRNYYLLWPLFVIYYFYTKYKRK